MTSYHVYSNGGVAGAPVDYSTVVATVSGTSWSSGALAASSSWRYGVRAFDTVSTLEEKNVDAQVAINLNGSQVDVTLIPQVAPLLVSAAPLAAGSVLVTWAYPLVAGKPWKPTGFKVYAGVGSVSYGSPVATVPYSGGPHFSATLTGYSDGNAVKVAVRAYNATGQESNTNVAAAVAAVTAPAPVVSLSATATAVYGGAG